MAQEEMLGGMTKCERVGGDKLVAAGSMAPVKVEKQTDCQQKSTIRGEGRERQKCSEVGNQK